MTSNFIAYIDESVSDDEFVLAGHIATPEAWKQLSGEWERLLPFGTRNNDGLFHFKMSEMAVNDERMSRVQAFYRLIEDNVLLSVSCRLNLHDFSRGFEEMEATCKRMNWSINFERWRNPWFFTFRVFLDHFHDQRSRFSEVLPLHHKVDFIFDDRAEKGPI